MSFVKQLKTNISNLSKAKKKGLNVGKLKYVSEINSIPIITGFIKIVFITLIEYTVVYTIIGHPNALLLGFLAMITQLIPYFGGIITNIIAAITAIVVSPALLIKTVITIFI